MQIPEESKPTTIKVRAIVPIFYSSVTNTSKKMAYELEEKLQTEGFLATVNNIGDVDHEEFLQLSGPAVFVMSTYGNGGSPADGQQFMGWLKKLQKKNLFENMEFSILGLGNLTFEYFCGNSKTFRQLLLDNAAKELVNFETCDSASTDNTAAIRFPHWSDGLIAKLKEKFEVRDMEVGSLLQKYRAVKTQSDIDDDLWTKNQAEWQKRLGKQFLAYHKAFKAEIIHIKELRTQKDGRSTLWVRMAKPEGLSLNPACNINIYPENVRKQGQATLQGSVTIESTKKNGKVAYPPMRLESLWKISNFNQVADMNLIKYAMTVSEAAEEVKSKYANMIKDPETFEKLQVRCWQINEQLQPGLDFMLKLGINTVRPYTLASWDPEQKYIDLIASIDPLGLTSKYFSSIPRHVRILPTESSFYIPENRPIVMIANGSGLAPFRSIAQYYLKSSKQTPPLYLYFGIQNKDTDYYFKDEWEALEKEGKIKLRVSESRADPTKKVYIQNLVKQDKAFFVDHLFEKNGVIFICGSNDMAKAVDTEIFEAIKVKVPIPFKAYKLSTELVKKKTIVKEVFH